MEKPECGYNKENAWKGDVEMAQYEWIPLYKEIAQKLLQFYGDRRPLVQLVNDKMSAVIIQFWRHVLQEILDKVSQKWYT